MDCVTPCSQNGNDEFTKAWSVARDRLEVRRSFTWPFRRVEEVLQRLLLWVTQLNQELDSEGALDDDKKLFGEILVGIMTYEIKQNFEIVAGLYDILGPSR